MVVCPRTRKQRRRRMPKRRNGTATCLKNTWVFLRSNWPNAQLASDCWFREDYLSRWLSAKWKCWWIGSPYNSVCFINPRPCDCQRCAREIGQLQVGTIERQLAWGWSKVHWTVLMRLEPPQLFRGRGEHPKQGLLKKRTFPESCSAKISANLRPCCKVSPMRHE